MATPKKLPSGKWRVRGSYVDPVTGKIERPSFTASTKAEAARLEAEWATKKKSLSNDLTVSDCITRYIKAKEASLSPATVRGYVWMQEHRFAEIGRMHISSLTDEIMQKYVSDLSLKVSPKTVRNTYGLLVAAVGMFSDRVFHVTMPAQNAKIYNIPTDEDIKLLMNAASDKLTLIIALAAFGTLRRGEIAALKYKDVLRDKNALYIHADLVLDQNGYYVYKESPKTDASARIVPLPQKVMDMIGEGDPEAYIVGINPGTIEKTYCALRKKVGLKCRFHDLRHYSASIMHAIGIPDQYIMEIGGWATDSVLKSVYRNTLSDQSERFRTVAVDHFTRLL